jgi:hypothetical protein
MGNLRITELDQSDSEQIQSDPPSSPEAGYQGAVFTLPPNRSNSDSRRKILVVSLDSGSITGENDQQRAQRLHRNALRTDRRANKDVIMQAEEDLKNAKRRNPRVGRRHPSPPRPRNLENEFILNYDGHQVFATPSANMAAVLQVFEGLPQTPEIKKGRARLHVAATQAQGLRREYSNYRAQSSSNSSIRPHRLDEEVNQPDLRDCLGRHDLRPRIDNRHRERDNAERERRRRYDEEHGAPGTNRDNRDCRPRDNDYNLADDLDGFSTFSDRLRAIQWPATFKPIGIEKFDGESDPKTWLRTYSITVRAANGNNDIMAAYFPVMMGRQALN